MAVACILMLLRNFIHERTDLINESVKSYEKKLNFSLFKAIPCKNQWLSRKMSEINRLSRSECE